MITKTIFLQKDECPIDAIASLGEDSKNAWIFIDKMSFYDLKNNCTCQKDITATLSKLYFKDVVASPETDIVVKNSGDWVEVLSIQAIDIAFTKRPSIPEIVFFISKDKNKEVAYGTRMYVPEKMCPIEFIINMGDEAKDKTFIFPRYLVSKIIMERSTKSINHSSISTRILWDGSNNFIEFCEIGDTQKYMLSTMKFNGFKIGSNYLNNIIYLV